MNMEDLQVFSCGECASPVQPKYGFNRTLCDGTPIPTYYPVWTCECCGETYFTYGECVELEDLARSGQEVK